MTDPRRAIPSIERLLGSPALTPLLEREPRALVVEALQEVQATLRARLGAGADPAGDVSDPSWYAERAAALLHRTRTPSLRSLINATGVVLHTNLGRAPLSDAALAAIAAAARGYSNLEFDLERGVRGSRYAHCVTLLMRLTGAEAALVVNNNAAALVLALNTLARDREAVISRGELVEIGGSFRIPEIMARSGARMVEVGATNRTRIEDYQAALGARTGLILKVHRSNFRIEGFTEEATVGDIVARARPAGVPVLHDLGSGLLVESASLGLPYEPTPSAALREGADVVTLSGDKLLGGPQAGILLGRHELIERMRRNPLCRAFRVDKLTLAALEATLAAYLDPARARREIPVLRMLTAPAAELADRAGRIAAALRERGVEATTAAGNSAVGGGAFPGAALATTVVRIPPWGAQTAAALERRLRDGEPPVVARVQADELVVDPRTVAPGEEAGLISAILQAAAPC
jgi:L-seryl-tRNA(Ser) seleniumtransferase